MSFRDVNARRLERERARRARIRRRRAVAFGALAVLVLVVAGIAVASGGGGSGSSPASNAAVTAAHTSHSGHAAAGARPTTVAAKGTGVPGDATVPILMYHVIAPPPPGAPFPGLYVPEPEFAAQMQALKSAGWHPITQDQLRAYWQHGARLPGKPIIITFDNGYLSQYTHALPVLRRMHWVAVENIQLSGLPPSQGGLTTPQVKALIAAGWELDTQGISHADLITLGPSELHYQVATARQILQRRYGVPVNWFCYPSGHYDATVVAAVRAAGFVGSTTVVPGWAAPDSDPFRLPRLRVLNGTSPGALLAQIAAAQGSTTTPLSYTGA